MKWSWSEYGERFEHPSGILALMDDLGSALTEGGPDLCMLGGGNPAPVPEMQEAFRKEWTRLLEDAEELDALLGNYDTSQGQPRFLDALADLFNRHYGWGVSRENIAVVNGSQSGCFYLFNLLAGPHRSGRSRHVLLPLSPEYIGYTEQGIAPDMFRAVHGKMEKTGTHRFKYHVDFDKLIVGDDTAALAASRPTNPTGNVLTDQEVARLSGIARERGIPLLLDNAYGAPFPGILFKDVTPVWEPHMILSFSLSKLGLPGTRTGIIVADRPVIRQISSMHAVTALASGNVGQSLVRSWLANDRLLTLCREVVRPFYEERSQRALRWWEDAFDDDVAYEIHEPEGSMFHWLRFPELPFSSRVLYQRLKEKKVLVIPGEDFFYGLSEAAEEQEQCIRVHTAMPADVVQRGIGIIAETLREMDGA